MRRAYLLIDVDVGKSMSVAAEVHDKPGVVFADTVNGPHDVIVVLEGTDAGAIVAKATQALRATDGNVTKAAEMLATHRRQLQRLMKRYNIDRSSVSGNGN